MRWGRNCMQTWGPLHYISSNYSILITKSEESYHGYPCTLVLGRGGIAVRTSDSV